ncbi:MAG: exopolysaccharide biosynthesis polyprenyl glycosylphosphotransferase [Cyclobacteriaceae bacterium]|nr:exopolysaccharide biosynthesis polyprenyl glycosylphosphotransferase [Cyclobacteriaceae bacterium]
MGHWINLVRAGYHRVKKYRLLIRLIIESIIAIAVICIAFALTRNLGGPDFVLTPRIVLFAILMYFIWITLYRSSTQSIIPRTERYRALIISSFQGSFIALLICLVFWILIGLNTIPFLFISLFIGLRLIYTITERLAAYRIFKFYRSKGYNTKHIIVIADAFSEIFIENLIVTKEWGFNVKYVLTNSELIHNKFSGRVKILKEDANLKCLLDFDIVDEVIYCKTKINDVYLKKVIHSCEEIGVRLRIQSNLSPMEPAKLQLQTVHMRPQMQLIDSRVGRFEPFLKNISDIFFSFIALVFLSPIFILIAFIVKIDSRGPVFFIQERIGYRGRKFKLIKFRTMVRDAKSVQHILNKQNETDGPTFKIKDDPRITKVGKTLRKTGLDELPQLFNVLIGVMSLIGPRPPLEKEVIQYERWQLRRLSVKPGISCTWQVLHNRNEVSFDKWMKLDLQYIDNWTILKDIKLMFLTFNTIIKATGR